MEWKFGTKDTEVDSLSIIIKICAHDTSLLDVVYRSNGCISINGNSGDILGLTYSVIPKFTLVAEYI